MSGSAREEFEEWVRAQPGTRSRNELAREGLRRFSVPQEIPMLLLRALDLPESEYDSLVELVAEKKAKIEAEKVEAIYEANRAARPPRQVAKPRGPSNATVAQKIGISERRLYTVLKGGTASRELAQKLAHHKGGEAEDYLRTPRPRGPVRQWPFREFVCENAEEAEGRERQPWEWLAFRFAALYESRKSKLPPDFESLDALLSAMRTISNFDIEARDAAPELWKRFRIWRLEQLHAEQVWAIESEEDFG